MSTAELIIALKELPLEERAVVFAAALGPLTPDRLAALRLLSDYMPDGTLHLDDDLDDFVEPEVYVPRENS